MKLTRMRLTVAVAALIALAAAGVGLPRMSQAASPQVDVFYAKVADAKTGVAAQSFPAGASGAHIGAAGSGDYVMVFATNVNLTTCAFAASTNNATAATTASVFFSPAKPNRVEVHTYAPDGKTSLDQPYDLIAAC